MEVLIYQGATALLLIPSFAHSQAKFFVSWLIAPKSGLTTCKYYNFVIKKHSYHKKFQELPLVAPWSVMDFSETKAETDEVKTMLPAFNAFKNGCASWLMWKTDSKFVDISMENSSTVNCTIGFRMFVPTLFTYWSNPQKGTHVRLRSGFHNVKIKFTFLSKYITPNKHNIRLTIW